MALCLTGFLFRSSWSTALSMLLRMSLDSAFRTLSKFRLGPTNSSGKVSAFILALAIAVVLLFKMSSRSVSVSKGTGHLPTTISRMWRTHLANFW